MPSCRHYLPIAFGALLLTTAGASAQLSNPIVRQRTDPVAVTSLVFLPDGKLLASVGPDGNLRLWDAATGKERRAAFAHNGGGYAVASAPGGKVLASGGADKLIRLWDSETARESGQLTGHDKAVTCLVFTPDGKTLISGSLDGTIRFWDLATAKERQKLPAHAEGVLSLDLARDGKVLASAGEIMTVAGGSTIVHCDRPRLWDPATGKEQARAATEGSMAILSPDGKLLAVLGTSTRIGKGPGGGLEIRQEMQFCIVDAVTGKEHCRPRMGAAWWVAFSPDSKTLAAVGNDRQIWLLDAATGKDLAKGPKLAGSPLLFTPDGKRLVWGNEEGRVSFGEVPAKE